MIIVSRFEFESSAQCWAKERFVTACSVLLHHKKLQIAVEPYHPAIPGHEVKGFNKEFKQVLQTDAELLPCS